uniref:Secreted protein n=1 Tax=Bursaphelenchus xylophilus TaxID=6326 RepID=A0A1I7STL1_BURXY
MNSFCGSICLVWLLVAAGVWSGSRPQPDSSILVIPWLQWFPTWRERRVFFFLVVWLKGSVGLDGLKRDTEVHFFLYLIHSSFETLSGFTDSIRIKFCGRCLTETRLEDGQRFNRLNLDLNNSRLTAHCPRQSRVCL